MTFPQAYKTELLKAIETIELDKVNQAIELFREARANGRHIFAGLAPGLYKVDVMLEGYALPDHLVPVQVRPKGCAEVPLPLQLDRSVSGHVLTRRPRPRAAR